MGSRTIGSLVNLVRGNSYRSSLLDQEGPYLLGLASIERNGGFRDDKLRTYGGPCSEKHLVYPGDMYVSLKDLTQAAFLLGSVARVPENIAVGRMTQDTVKLEFTDKNYPKDYFYWVLRTPQYKDYCKGRAQGTTNLSLSREDFLAFSIPEYSEERKGIVLLLEGIEKKELINKHTNQTLEKMAQALFNSWFVNFDLVMDNALAAGNAIPDALLTRAAVRKKAQQLPDFTPLPDDIRALFPSEFEQTNEPKIGIAGWIPKGWQTGTLSSLAKFTSDRIDGSELTFDNYISTDNMLSNKQGVTTAAKVPDVKTTPAFKPGDILISNIRPYFQKIWFATFSGGRSNDVLGFEAIEEQGREYLLNFLYQDMFFEYMMTTSKGSKMPRGDKTAIMNWPTVIPSRETQVYFSDFVKSYYQVIPVRNKESEALSKLRNTLLPKLISGEITLNQDVA